MAKAGEITIDILANVARLQRDVAEGVGIVRRGASQMAQAASVATGALGGLAGAFSVGALAMGFRQAITELDNLNDAADRTGSSVERLSGLEAAMAPFGTTLEQITGVTGRLVRAMSAADDETRGAGAAFAALGVETRNADGTLRDTVDVLRDVALGLNGYADGSNKTAIAQAIFGKQGADLLPTLKDLASVGELNARVTTQQAEQAEKAAQAMNRFAFEAKAVGREITSAVLPALDTIVQRWQAIRSSGAGILDILNFSLTPEAVLRQQRGRGSTGILPFGNANRVQSALDEQERNRRFAEIYGGSIPYDRPSAPTLPAATAGAAGRGGPRGRDIAEESRNAVAAAERELALSRLMTEEQRTLFEIQSGRYRDLTRSAQQRLVDLARERDAGRENAEQAAQERAIWEQFGEAQRAAAREATAAQRAREQELQSILAQTATGRQEEMRRAQDLIDEAFFSGRIGEAQFEQATAIVNGLRQANADGRRELDELVRAFEGWGRRSAGVIAEFVMFGKGSFSDLFRSIAAEIVQLSVQRTITGPLFDFVSGSLGGLFPIGGGAGGAASAGAGFFGGISGARAGGGSVMAGRTYLVGERGPELLTMGGNGMVAPTPKATTVYNTYYIDSRSDRAAIIRDIEAGSARTEARIVDKRRRGAPQWQE